jgi:hypothetical protein
MAPLLGTIGSFDGVYSIMGTVTVNEGPNYAGAVMVFQQTAAPTGWTKSTTFDDAILTATTSTISNGGTLGLTSAVNTTRSITGTVTYGSFTVGGTTMTAPMIPSHTHPIPTTYAVGPFRGPPSPTVNPTMSVPATAPISGSTSYPPAYTGPTSHVHPNPPSLATNPTTYFSRSFNLKYVDVIVATKN